ncbi:MAG: hypothetical protein HYR55_17660 [Acidobacteria bacterium]|nr:hypothetical protein [Acidobacteriota bacterium]MBI3658538.1 hypothetical protein [Acidobacteriota bacterium]
MKKFVCTTLLALLFSWIVLAGDTPAKPYTDTEPAGTLPVTEVTCGNLRVHMNAWGNNAGTRTFILPGRGEYNIYEYLKCWTSINNGPLQRVNSTNYRMDAPVTPDVSGCPDAGIVTSRVIRNTGDLSIDFVHMLSNAVTEGRNTGLWETAVTMTNISDATLNACLYCYADADVLGTFDNDVATFHTEKDRFEIKDPTDPNVVMTFTDKSGTRDSWEESLYPQLRDKLGAATSCIQLANGPATLTGDWTGAYKHSATLGPGETKDATFNVELLDSGGGPGDLPDLVPYGIYDLRVSVEAGERRIRFGLLTGNIGGTFRRDEDVFRILAKFLLFEKVGADWVQISDVDKPIICTIDSRQAFACIAEPPRFTCTRGNQGISRGWMDDYPPPLAFQFVVLGERYSGDFKITAISDPYNQVEEVDKDNNCIDTFFTLDGDGITVTGNTPCWVNPCG